MGALGTPGCLWAGGGAVPAPPVLLGLPATPRRHRRDPRTLSCGAAGGGRRGHGLLPTAGRRVGWPARGLSSWRLWRGAQSWSLWTSSRARRQPLPPVQGGSCPHLKDGSWGPLHFRGRQKRQPRPSSGPLGQAQVRGEAHCHAGNSLTVEFFFLKIVGKYFLRPTHSDWKILTMT